jgi:hypothetical protein
MQRLSAWARWIGAGVFTIFIIPIAVEFVKHVAENIGLYDRPREAAGTVLNFFLGLAELPWLRVTALVLGGLTMMLTRTALGTSSCRSASRLPATS